jgi:hypothetical protein
MFRKSEPARNRPGPRGHWIHHHGGPCDADIAAQRCTGVTYRVRSVVPGRHPRRVRGQVLLAKPRKQRLPPGISSRL